MCPDIEIDDEVWGSLKERAEPFTDTPNSVLRHLLGLDNRDANGGKNGPGSRLHSDSRARKRGKKRRAPAGSLLPEQAYELPILDALRRAGGKAPAREVIARAGESVEAQLTTLDQEALPTGGFRWENRVQFTRLRLKERGLIESGSPRGIWEISEQGVAFLEAAEGEGDGE